MVCSAFVTIHQLGICRFLSEDLSDLVKLIPESDAKIHYLSSAHGIFDMLHQSQIHFSAPDETVLAYLKEQDLSFGTPLHSAYRPDWFELLSRSANAGRRRMRGACRLSFESFPLRREGFSVSKAN